MNTIRKYRLFGYLIAIGFSAIAATAQPSPQLRLSRTTLGNEAMRGYDAPAQSFEVWNATLGSEMEFDITKDVPWLMTGITSGTSTGERHQVEVTYSTTGLRAGVYHGIITVTAPDAINPVQDVNVTLQIKPIAVLVVSDATGMTRSIRKGESAAPGEFVVWNGSGYPQGVLNYRISSDASWLRTSPSAGTIAPETAHTITVSYDTTDLAPGVYRGTVIVSGVDESSGLDAIESPKRIAVELTVKRVNPLDFSGDGAADMIAYHESSGRWRIQSLDGQYRRIEQFGGPGFKPTTGDYSGNGLVDLAVYRASSTFWYAKPLDSYTITVVGNFGGEAYRPVRGDFDGDGRHDFALYCENTGNWYVMSPDGRIVTWGFRWGGPGFEPLVGDFSGDGKDDLAVYFESTGEWYIISVDDIIIAWGVVFGGPGLQPLAGDFNGDGMTDLALYDRARGWWYIGGFAEGVMVWAFPWGAEGFTPLTGDYSGDGVADLAVYRDGLWYITALDGTILRYRAQLGAYGYTPIGM